MLIGTTVVVLLLAIAAIATGVVLWPSRHDILSGALIFVGLFVATVTVPWMVNTQELANRPDWLSIYGKVLHVIDTWNWVLWLIAAVLLYLDAAAAASKKWAVSSTFWATPVPPPAAGAPSTGAVQWQRMFILIALGTVALTICIFGANDAYADSQRPNVSDAFIDFQEKTRGAEGVIVNLTRSSTPVQIVFEGKMLEDEDEQTRWKEAVAEAYDNGPGKANGHTLIVDTVHAVIAHSHNGRVIDELLVEFTGKVDKPDPEVDEDVEKKAFPVPSGMDEQRTNDWLQKWTGTTTTVTVGSPAAAGSSPSPVGTGTVIEPPLPPQFRTIIRR